MWEVSLVTSAHVEPLNHFIFIFDSQEWSNSTDSDIPNDLIKVGVAATKATFWYLQILGEVDKTWGPNKKKKKNPNQDTGDNKQWVPAAAVMRKKWKSNPIRPIDGLGTNPIRPMDWEQTRVQKPVLHTGDPPRPSLPR